MMETKTKTKTKTFRWRYQILFCAILLVIVLSPILASFQTDTRAFGRLMYSVVLFSAVLTVVGTKRILPAIAIFALVSLAFDWATLLLDQVVPEVAQHGVRVLFLLTLTFLILIYVLGSGPVNNDKIFAALCAYMLMGLIWAELYAMIEIIHPGSFIFPDILGGLPNDEERMESDLVFYSYVTLTTLGYGDITAAAPMARTLSLLEAVLGQMYLAVLVARLVGLHIASTRQGNSA